MNLRQLLIAIFFVCSAGFLYAQSPVNISASKDNTLYDEAPGTLSNGQGGHLFAGKTKAGQLRRGLIAFDLSGVSAGTVVDSVKLTLSLSQTISGIQTIQLRRVLADWGEGASNADANEGRGAPATTGDATWLHKFFNTAFWANPGGDFASTASASQAVGGIGFYTWGSTPQMVADVQAWLDTPSVNFGWLLLGNESAFPTTKRFDSREDTVQAKRPKLTVFYHLKTSVAEKALEIPSQFRLLQNYPNPFNPSTTITFHLPLATPVSLKIFEVSGREIATLAAGRFAAGEHRVQWHADQHAGGIYFYRLQAGDFVEMKKLLLLR